MKYEWIDTYCLEKKDVVSKKETGERKFLANGRVFAVLGEDMFKREILTLRNERMSGRTLRKRYLEIVPGYPMNDENWISVYLEGTVPRHIIEKAIDLAYQIQKNIC